MPTTNPPAPEEINFVIQRGITMVEQEFQFLDFNKQPLDYTGYTLAAQARQGVDESLFIDLEPEWIDASIGSWKFPEKTPVETDAMSVGNYYYEVVPIRPDSGRDEPPMIGLIQVVSINTHLP